MINDDHLIVVIVEDLEVLGRFDDGSLTEPSDLRTRVALHFANKFNLQKKYHFISEKF
jgi:hypothetical protein